MNNDKIKEEVFDGCRVVYKTNKKHTLELFKDFLSKRSAKLFLKDSSKKEKEAI
ncbi:hypothetical protein ACTHHL_12050 [Aeribacillus composti]|uniref:Uncharacterized protein n=1 Tax=Anoxybacillus phage A403 TaxID=2099336 RepID=A0A2P1JTZ7_9CAUD|nr:hypothetical protein HWB56_gp49 [Anoxybacillus phage A403]AVO22617.1 hypothetical protein [Anoxybacillus phage A403]